jgi:hypothetical protein
VAPLAAAPAAAEAPEGPEPAAGCWSCTVKLRRKQARAEGGTDGRSLEQVFAEGIRNQDELELYIIAARQET